MERDFEGIVVGEIAIDDLSGKKQRFTRQEKFKQRFRGFVASQGYSGCSVFGTRSLTRLTGFTALVWRDGRVIKFMSVEPKENPEKVVLVIKSESPADKGTLIDTLNHRFKAVKNFSLSQPFANLDKLLDK